MRVFKWSPTFTPENESSITPIWVSFPELPAHLFRKDALFAIANNIGTPLQIADSTFYQYNLANARVCVEIDLLKPLLKEIDLKICGATIVQNIVYEQIPNYCSLCKHVGHRDAECYSKGDAPKSPPNRRTAATGKQKMKENAVAQYVIKGKNVVEYQARQAFDKIPEKKLTVTEVGGCHRYVPAETDVSVAENEDYATENDIIRVVDNVNELETASKDGENVGVGMVNVENDVVVHANLTDFDAKKEDELYVEHEKETENVYVESVEKKASKDVNVEATFEVMNMTHAIEANNGCDENHSATIEIDAKDSLETVYELEESQENIVKPIDSVGTLIIRPNNSVCDLMGEEENQG
ncbi:UNVERIFIED_CONTAM: hypothetical protein Sradi_4659700 [Sesamum radiatum]|uniref:DUF4283 domain-containing protein n=1 Tax=Sesamum radiatum TaxID=300843 RepID=A0AAW2MVA2_SESRA